MNFLSSTGIQFIDIYYASMNVRACACGCVQYYTTVYDRHHYYLNTWYNFCFPLHTHQSKWSIENIHLRCDKRILLYAAL